jgi:hypothetical protein
MLQAKKAFSGMRRYEIRSHRADMDRFLFDTHPTDDFIIETWKNCIIINYLFFNNTVHDVVDVLFLWGKKCIGNVTNV